MVELSHPYLGWHGLGLALGLLVVSVSMAVACNAKNSTHRPSSSCAVIPFLFLEEPSWRDLHVMVEKYREDSTRLLHGLSQSLELALHSEREMMLPEEAPLFSHFLKSKMDRVASALEHNEEELKKLMKPYPVRLMLPSMAASSIPTSNSPSATTKNPTHKNSTSNNLFTIPKSYGSHDFDKNAYDCGAQVIAHLVRDWTPLGKPVREHTYDWCCQMSLQYIRTPGAPILVPGAGLGRLAFELFRSSFAVEANELSLSMATAAQAILQDHQQGILYPFALDSLANEVIAEQRFDTTEYPDSTLPCRNNHSAIGSLSYTVGADFVHAYRWQRPPSTFAGVVTCFFLDTATNVYEYISTIQYSLPRGGIWINIGPLRWHRNSMLHPASDELQQILLSFQFEILQWKIDSTPMEYRDSSESNFARSTFYEGYRALRFVLRKR